MDRFDQIANECARPGWAMAYSLTRNAADADDVMQQAFVVAWQRRAVAPDRPWPWFAVIIVNCSRNFRRKKARLQTHETPPEVAGNDSPAQAAQMRELRDKLLGALEELPPEEREAVALCHIGGLTQAEASAATGIKLNTIKARVRRGLDRLRSKLKPQEASLEAYLAGLTIPAPAAGWPESVARWRDNAMAHAGGAATAGILVKLAMAGLIGAGVAGATWLIAGEPKGEGAVPTLHAAGLPPDNRAQHRSTGIAAAQPQGQPATPDDRRPAPRTEETNQTTPPAHPVLPRVTIQPPGPNPPGSTQVRTEYYENGSIAQQWTEVVTPGEERLHGWYRRYHRSGGEWQVGYYEFGSRTGQWTEYFDSGLLARRGNYAHNELNGTLETFFESGAKYAEGHFTHGKRVGQWRQWHKSGELEAVYWYENDQRHGQSSHYDESGTLLRTTEWHHDVKHGEEREYDPNGVIVVRSIFENGKQK